MRAVFISLMLLSPQILKADMLIERLFRLPGAKWGILDLNELAFAMVPPTLPNPLLDAQKCAAWVRGLHTAHRIDYSYGGYWEDRKVLWRGHYHSPGKAIHLGVDYNVPEDTKVFCPSDATVVDSRRDADKNGGWGGRVILRNHAGLYLVIAHLDPKNLPLVDEHLREGSLIGKVGKWTVNGGWFPHLHIQAMRTFRTDFDGYGTGSAAERIEFPHPELFLKK